jgi:hypothetical protein
MRVLSDPIIFQLICLDITRKKNQVSDRPAQEDQIEDSRSINQVAGHKFNNMKNPRLAASVFR